MPNDDYIKRSDARAYVRHAHGKGLNLMECIDAIPAADVEPKRKTGRWIDLDDHLLCSSCGASHTGPDKNYCPNCGAKMDEEDDNGNKL